MRRVTAAAVAAAAGCGQAPPPSASAGSPPAAPPIVTLTLDTAPGLSGLGAAPDGALWTVAERGEVAYRVVVDRDRIAALEAVPIEGVPDVDLESIEPLPDGRFLLGAEGIDAAGVLVATRDGGRLVVDPTWAIDAAALGVALRPNHGVEGVCARPGEIVIAFETPIDHDGARSAQVAFCPELDPRGCLVRRMELTTATGKLSALDCAGGAVLAIERHFEVARLVALAASDRAELVRDLAEVAAGRNLEGLARLADGRLALVVDNQWKTITGPSELVPRHRRDDRFRSSSRPDGKA
jgi:hypothetical protein